VSRRGSRSPFEAIRTEGGLLPHDLLQRIAARDPKLPGMKDADYGLLEHEREGEVVNRAWTRLLAAWAGFRAALEKEPPTAAATTITRDRWLLPLFQALDFGRLSGRKQAFDLEGRSYPISHEHEATHTAIHLLGARVGLDVRTQAVQGAAKTTPHGLVQDFLNRSSAHDWSLLTNGLVLRLLRDSKSITRQAYVEFDLEEILDDERYSEFRVLWLVCHESRFRREGENTCLLEQWFERGKEEGVRALDRLRGGVEEAIRVFGRGFLRHRDNAALREALGDGRLDAQDYYRQLLRLAYRLIFLFVTEDRGVLLDPSAPEAARDRYTRYYSTSQLRALAVRRRGGPHSDLWTRLKLVMDRLYGGCPELGLPALGSFLWRPEAIGQLGQSSLANEDFLSAFRMLVEVSDGKVVMPVAWAQVGADELGSVYESLLELHPRIEREAGAFDLATAAGHERKTTGSYYTPTSLVESLLDTALDPVLDAKCRSKNPEAAILEMRVCDPACGSGHFLVAAARRIARRLAAVRSGDDEPSPDSLRHALRDVVGRCIFGVDQNSMAVELCKVSLWLEAVEPGRPLSFLDPHVQVGNSLFGATPALIAKGVPDDAFDPLEGDDAAVVKRIKKLNREERRQRSLPFGQGGISERFNLLAARMEAIEREADASLGGVEAKGRMWAALRSSEELRLATLVADAWCASFVWRKVGGDLELAAVTHDVLARLMAGERLDTTQDEVNQLARAHGFLHWHLAFPQVLAVPQAGERPDNEATGWSGGFDVVLGNPPWEQVEIKEQEWFATRHPEIAGASTAAARKRMIDALRTADQALHSAFSAALRSASAGNHFVRASGRFPLCGKGRMNTYALFAEHNLSLLGRGGRAGFIVPTGIATDDNTKDFFGSLVANQQLVSLYDFKNRDELFYDIGHRTFKFCLLTLSSSAHHLPAEFVFFASRTSDISDPARRFTLSLPDIRRINPNTGNCPTFRSGKDAALNRAIYEHAGVLIRADHESGNRWGAQFTQGIFNMASDSAEFHTSENLEVEGWRLAETGDRYELGEGTMVPLYEAKMLHHFEHRFGDYRDRPSGSENTSLPQVPLDRLQDPSYVAFPRYWVKPEPVAEALHGKWSRNWLLGWRDITKTQNERTLIAAVIPRVGVGHTTPLFFTEQPVPKIAALVANLSSLVLDYATRQKVGGTHLTFTVMEQLPILPPSTYDAEAPWAKGVRLDSWILPRVLELSFTAWDLKSFACDCGYGGPPFRWDAARRSLLRAELDAAFFILHGLARDDADFILDTFPIVRRHDEESHGEYRTKRVILEVYDRMAEAKRAGHTYETILSPAPADPSVAHSGASSTRATPQTVADVTSSATERRPRRRSPPGASS